MSSKRKQSETVSPPSSIRNTRRRFLSATMSSNPSIESGESHQEGVVIAEGVTLAEEGESPQLQFGYFGLPQISLHTGPGGNIDLTSAIDHLLNSPAFSTALATSLVPLLTPLLSASLMSSINDTVRTAVQDAVKPLQEQVTDLTDRVNRADHKISSLTQENDDLKERVRELEVNVVDLDNRCINLDCGLEQLEQYGRRNSLRFHNVPLESESADTDDAIANLCTEKLGVTITADDICRSHRIGRANRFGSYQVICRFRNWKLKNKVFTNKRKLKDNEDHTFITEDLTKYRQEIVSEMLKAKRAGKIHAFWSTDGRLFMKVTESGFKHRVDSIDELNNLVPPSDEPWQSDGPW